MMEPSSHHSSTSGGDDSLMSLDDSVSINDDGFLSNLESEYDYGLDTSYSDFSSCATASTSSSFSIAKEDLRDDESHEGYRDTKMTAVPKKDVEEEELAAIMPIAYNSHNEESFFDSLRSLDDSLTTGLSPPSLPRPSLAAAAAAQTSSSPSTPPSANNQNNRRSSIGSMFESLLRKPINSIGTIGSISNFDIKEAFPPLLPLTDCFSRQVTPTTAAKVKQGPDPPPPIPEFKPFKDGYGRSPSRTISEDTDDLMDMDIDLEETLSSNETSKPSPTEEKKEAALKPPPPPPPPTEITPPEPSRRKKRSFSSHKKGPAGTSSSSSSAAAATNKQRVSSQSSASSQKKRRKRPNQKKRKRRTEPEVKKFVVTISSKDVLMGRGGRSNHHEGNEVYRKRILKLQKTYKALSRDEKTQMSKDVVQWIYKRGGKFLQRDDSNKKPAGSGGGCNASNDEGSSWYVVTAETARQKVSQALREDHTLEGRMLKKSRTTSYKQQGQKKKKNPPSSSNASV